jgi:hypothetical protein
MKINKSIILVILLFILGSVFVSAADKIYLIELEQKGDIFLATAKVSEGFVSNLDGQYRYTLLSEEGKVLDAFIFGIEEDSTDIHTHTVIGDDPENVETTHFQTGGGGELITAAFFSDGKTIRLSNPDGTTLAEVDVSRFKNVCGDGVCSEGESGVSCELDCPLEVVDGGVEEGDVLVNLPDMKVILIVLGIVGLVVVGALLFIRMRNGGGSGDNEGAVHQQQQSPDNLMP